MKLFCLPYAGGSASSIYSQWKKPLSNQGIEVVPIELPGRGRRMGETLLTDLNEMAVDGCSTICKLATHEPYGIFGYSMGALLAYEIYYLLKGRGIPEPVQMFFAAKSPPDYPGNYLIHDLPDEAFKQEIYKLEGTPALALDDPNLSAILLPVLRADYMALENYVFQPRKEKLQGVVSVLYGIDDSITKSNIDGWSRHTSARCQFHAFHGGHFFIKDAPAILNAVSTMSTAKMEGDS